jgi:putative tricarboxylic transport membrane protein
VGFLIGLLRRGRHDASFISYGLGKAVSRHPEEFGKGDRRRGRPEGSNNARRAARWCRC